MNVRPYLPSDFTALYTIEEICFAPALRFSREYMRNLLRRSSAAAWIVEENERMIGFSVVCWKRERLGVVAYIETIEVLPEDRGKGSAGELLRCMEASARKVDAVVIWLHVAENNASAIRLYDAHGYQFKGREENYYQDGNAALAMWKPLREGLIANKD